MQGIRGDCGRHVADSRTDAAQPRRGAVHCARRRFQGKTDRSGAKTETTPIPQIYGDGISNLRKNHDAMPDGLLAEVPHFSAINTMLYRQRHKTLPRLPKTRQEINMEGEWTRTEGGDVFLRRVEGREPILLFTTDRNL